MAMNEPIFNLKFQVAFLISYVKHIYHFILFEISMFLLLRLYGLGPPSWSKSEFIFERQPFKLLAGALGEGRMCSFDQLISRLIDY
jgi:hypothetical protein